MKKKKQPSLSVAADTFLEILNELKGKKIIFVLLFAIFGGITYVLFRDFFSNLGYYKGNSLEILTHFLYGTIYAELATIFLFAIFTKLNFHSGFLSAFKKSWGAFLKIFVGVLVSLILIILFMIADRYENSSKRAVKIFITCPLTIAFMTQYLYLLYFGFKAEITGPRRILRNNLKDKVYHFRGFDIPVIYSRFFLIGTILGIYFWTSLLFSHIFAASINKIIRSAIILFPFLYGFGGSLLKTIVQDRKGKEFLAKNISLFFLDATSYSFGFVVGSIAFIILAFIFGLVFLEIILKKVPPFFSLAWSFG